VLLGYGLDNRGRVNPSTLAGAGLTAMTEEGAIQKAITDWLSTLPNCWHLRVHYQKPTSRGSQKPGVPDLYCCFQGRHVWFEIKRPRATTQDNQEAEIAKMEQAGAEVFIVRSLAEVRNILLGEAA
jgi:hypothetical protein